MQFKHNLGDLKRDIDQTRRDFVPAARLAVRVTAKEGNDDAKAHARLTSREHARKYPGTFSSEMLPGFRGFAVDIFAAEYGPLHKGQGMLASILENGSRNNPPHHDLAQSADKLPAQMGRRIGVMLNGLFW